jgi:hypothetical protein
MKYLIHYKLFESVSSKLPVEELQNKLYDITDILLQDDVLVKAYIHENGTIILMDLKSSHKGMGTKGLEALSKFADTYNLPIMTVASSTYGSDIERLCKFYNRFGFIYVQDMPSLNGVEMRRDPNHSEKIIINVNIGDTIYSGRFKNKKTVIKEIGEDETGMPTINKKKVVTFRTTPPKKNPNFKGYNRWKKKKKKD